jgi:hypothetical protein
MDLTGLLGKGVTEHLALAEQVIAQVVDRVARDESLLAADRTPAERIAVAIGNRLARMVLDEESSAARYDDLIERNIALASALGACDCWGDNADCPICDGEGRPGWLPPDHQYFSTYVLPVLRTRPTNNHHHEENINHHD